ncbi:MAG: RHS repeat-associated core domain-containing protein [Candidatus Omnitrophica bacterium]|nr:RHS repeat-associated core domain-containing protein [Candidatus Omnitrophota bacterium]
MSNSFRYVGKYGVMADADDLLYMRARYYKPSIGRFINKDPIGLRGGINLYGYVGGNPIRFVDPLGLVTWPYSGKGWGGVILIGAGGTLITIPGGQVPGGIMIGIGIGLTIWDLVEGVQQAEEKGEGIADIIAPIGELEKIDEKLDEITGDCP